MYFLYADVTVDIESIRSHESHEYLNRHTRQQNQINCKNIFKVKMNCPLSASTRAPLIDFGTLRETGKRLSVVFKFRSRECRQGGQHHCHKRETVVPSSLGVGGLARVNPVAVDVNRFRQICIGQGYNTMHTADCHLMPQHSI